jgi:hypothetical protein
MRMQTCPRSRRYFKPAEQKHRGVIDAAELLDCVLLVVRADTAIDRPQPQQQFIPLEPNSIRKRKYSR